jgi:hypothetical protein
MEAQLPPSGFRISTVLQEWPADQLTQMLTEAKSQCDALLFVIDPSQGVSIQYFMDALQFVSVQVVLPARL